MTFPRDPLAAALALVPIFVLVVTLVLIQRQRHRHRSVNRHPPIHYHIAQRQQYHSVDRDAHVNSLDPDGVPFSNTPPDSYVDRIVRLLPFLTYEDKVDLIAMAETALEERRKKNNQGDSGTQQ